MRVVLKPDRDKAIRNKHPWIFSGAVASFPQFDNGDVLDVYSASGEFLAKAYFHKDNSISGRVLTFLDEPIEEVLDKRISQALSLRAKFFNPEVTNCYRLINAEGDGIPGLIVDIYDDIAVIQVNTCGIEKLKPYFVEKLFQKLPLRGIYEKSESSARRQEGLCDFSEVLMGECPQEILVKENGALFLVNIEKGQKTGLFLDQREMRSQVMKLSSNRRVLNCFAYTAAFSIFALKGGASHVTSVDISDEACRYARENTTLNHLPLSSHEVICSDVFHYLKNCEGHYDLVILDPPAFAKKRQDVNDACRGYKQINRMAMQRMPKNSYLLTSSCSHFIDEQLFQQLLFQSAIEAKREVTICSRHLQAIDHPVSLFHPEGGYLKSLLLHLS